MEKRLVLQKHLMENVRVKENRVFDSDVYQAILDAMEEYAEENKRIYLVEFAEVYQNCHIDDTPENTVDWFLKTKQ